MFKNPGCSPVCNDTVWTAQGCAHFSTQGKPDRRHSMHIIPKLIFTLITGVSLLSANAASFDQIDLSSLHEVMTHLGTKRSDDDLLYALNNTKTDIRTTETDWNALPDSSLRVQLQEMATEYGYLEE